jgi:charged multivesicular body protein 1
VKKAIEKGNVDGAKIYAQNAIRKKTEALNYLRLASRLDAVVSRLDTQAKMNAINSSMGAIVKQLDRALAGNNLERVADTMDQFERQFENLDVQSQFVEGAMNAQASLATPEADVNLLLQQVAEEHGLETQLNLPQAGAAPAAVAAPAAAAPENDLSQRLAQLRGK